MEPSQSDLLHKAALQDLHKGFTARAEFRLRQAAEAGYPPAQLAYARMLFDARDTSTRQAACEWLDGAAEQRLPEALYARSAARYAGLCGPASRIDALDDLNAAASAGHPAAEAALALAWQERGDPDARAVARAWLERAAAHGSRFARIVTRGEGTADDARAAAETARALPNLATDTRAPSKPLHTKPLVAIADAALSAAECGWLRLNARAGLRPSRILDPETGHPRPNPIRTGMTTYFAPSRLEFPALRVMERLAGYAQASLLRAEPLAVLRYRPGEQYRPHRDALGAAALTGDPLCAAGDRAATVLAYLNHPTAGGETVFPELAIRVDARRGRVLIFENLAPDRRPDPLSLHAGLPVTRGTKWLASLWIREQNLPG